VTGSPRATPPHSIRRSAGGAAVAALLALSACQAPKPAVVPPVAEAPPANDPAADPATAALPPEPVINDDPQQLMGIGPGALSAVLGDPELVRREAPAEIWQYRNDGCVLDVFLYDTDGRRTVTYVEARDGDAQRIDARTCLNTLLRARLAQPLG